MVANQKMLNCEQVWREVSNYFDGEVDAALRAAMDEHFQTCKKCASVLAGTQNVVKLYGDDRMLEVPAGFSRRLEKRLARSSAMSMSWSSWSAWLVPLAAMALIAGGVQLARSYAYRNSIRSQQADPGHNIPPSLVVVVSSGSRLFHVPGCSFIHDKDSQRTLTAKQALDEGYTPCTRCLRQYLKTWLFQHGEQVADRDADAGSPKSENAEEKPVAVEGSVAASP